MSLFKSFLKYFKNSKRIYNYNNLLSNLPHKEIITIKRYIDRKNYKNIYKIFIEDESYINNIASIYIRSNNFSQKYYKFDIDVRNLIDIYINYNFFNDRYFYYSAHIYDLYNNNYLFNLFINKLSARFNNLGYINSYTDKKLNFNNTL